MTVYITEAGGTYLLRALNGESLIFTHVAIGSGTLTTNPVDATGLVHQEKYLNIDSTSILDGLLTIVCSFTNASVTTGFKITEYGIFAQDMDDANEEILYAYISQPSATADYVPAGGDRPKSFQISPKVTIGDAQNISAIINSSLTYVSEAEFENHTGDTSNPHQVTKTQVGLGNVENVSVANMQPGFQSVPYDSTYTQLVMLPQDKLPTLFSKIHSFLNLGLNHFRSRANPHEVTLDQIGGAAESHTHKTADITEGTLGVSHGGTGHTSYEQGSVLIGDGNRIVPRNGFRALFREPDAVAPVWGTLPVTCGGTGENTEGDYTADIMSRVRSQGVPVIVQGSYTGNGNTSTGKTLDFSSAPKMIMVTRESSSFDSMEAGMGFFAVRGTTQIGALTLEWGDDSVRFVASTAQAGFNTSGIKYHYVVLI